MKKAAMTTDERRGYTRHPQTVACYAPGCPHGVGGRRVVCARAELAMTRGPRLGDLTEPALIADGTVCAHVSFGGAK